MNQLCYKVAYLNTYFLHGSVAIELREGSSFNSSYLCSSFPNLTMKKLWWLIHIFAKITVKIKAVYFLESLSICCLLQTN